MTGPGMIGLLETPLPVDVEPDAEGSPAVVRWEPRERVLEIVARWRVDDSWWRAPVSRMYYEIATPTALLVVFRDLIAGEWYLERIHD